MSQKKNLVRLLAIIAALLLFASACGDDSSTDAGADPGPSANEDEGDVPSGEVDGDMPSEDEVPSGEVDGDMPSGAFDCAEIQDTLENAGELIGGSDTTDDPEASFNQYRASLVALGEQAPEISDDVDTAVAALEGFAAVMERYDWTTDFSDSSQALEFSQAILAEGNMLEMGTSMAAIAAWISTSCTPN